MAKRKTIFTCAQCAFQTPKWMGKCPECQSWNSLTEEVLPEKKTAASERDPTRVQNKKRAVSIDSVELEKQPRIELPSKEFARVLGGGLTAGSVTLLSGDPGVGKSTLLLGLLGQIAKSSSKPLLYLSGEESLHQIADRARRFAIGDKNILLVAENNLLHALEHLEEVKPRIAIIDSVQTLYSPHLSSIPGTVSQVREVADRIVRFSKQLGISVFLVGHVTKDGAIAGPRTLEHLVDTVLHLEGSPDSVHRILRVVKNRFGPSNEIGIFAMHEDGLKDAGDASKLFLAGREQEAPGSVVFPMMEGSRCMFLEVQGLVSKSSYGNPIRTSVGFDRNRLNMLLAVMEKRASISFADQDVHVNVVGGMKIKEPAADLAVMMALVSSLTSKAMSADHIVFGEVGLVGEVRKTVHQQNRIKEALALGFSGGFVPKSKNPADQGFRSCQNINDALAIFA